MVYLVRDALIDFYFVLWELHDENTVVLMMRDPDDLRDPDNLRNCRAFTTSIAGFDPLALRGGCKSSRLA